MMRIRNFGAVLIFGSILVYYFVSLLGSAGPLADLAGDLVAQYPFHQPVAAALADSLGYDISMIPATGLSWLDEMNVLLIAIVCSSGIANTLISIFCPEGGGARSFAVSILSSVVTILVASQLFGTIAVHMNRSFGGKVLWTLFKVALMIVLLLVFIVFVKAAAELAKGEITFGLLGFFALRAVVRTLLIDVLSVYVLLSVLNRADSLAMPATVAYVVIMLVVFVTGSIRSAGS